MWGLSHGKGEVEDAVSSDNRILTCGQTFLGKEAPRGDLMLRKGKGGIVFWRRERPVQRPRVEREGAGLNSSWCLQSRLFSSDEVGKSC